MSEPRVAAGSQTARILELLRERGERGVTALDALEMVGSFRLAARIADLHAAGYEITSTIEPTPAGKRIARYRLVPAFVQTTMPW